MQPDKRTPHPMDAGSLILASIPLLAREDDDFNWGKVIGPAIFILIWVVSLISSALSKKKKQQQETWTGDVVEVPQPAPRPPPLPTARRVPPPLPKTPKVRKPKAQRKPPPVIEATAELVEIPKFVANLPEVAGHRGVPANPSASAVRRMLTPKALKQVYVVSELFDRKQ